MNIKEFFKRWGEGIQKVTAYQQMKISLIGNFLVFVGVIIGLITTFILKVWWLFFILCGSFLLTSMSTLANVQKVLILKKINDRLKEDSEYIKAQEQLKNCVERKEKGGINVQKSNGV